MADALDQFRPFPTVIKDRAFDDPDALRRFALSQEFLDCRAFNARYGTDESWPGARGPSLHTTHRTFVQQFTAFVLSDVLRFPPSDFRANCSFQLTRAGDGDSWVHRDAEMYRLAGLVYLTPGAPADGGTLFYRETSPGEYEVTDVVANRFNRLIVFDTQVPHKSNRYFGSSKEDGRLTMPFFIDFRLQPSPG